MKVLLSLNSFKGSCNSIEANAALAKGMLKKLPASELTVFPLFDGGDGSVEGLWYHLRLKKINVATLDALGNQINAKYLIDEQTKTAYIEMALASGLGSLKSERKNILLANTAGTGILMLDAIKRKCSKVVLMVGGSATNDAGIGVLSAFGFKFFDGKKQLLDAHPINLNKITKVAYPDHQLYKSVKVEIWTDVKNPFSGLHGAVAVYSPQKGAGELEQKKLEQGMVHFNNHVITNLRLDLNKIPGTGAAGGIGGGLVAYINATIKPAGQQIFKLLHVERFIQSHDYIITGEGSLDKQSLYGKLVHSLCTLSKKHHKKVVGICGYNQLTAKESTRLGFEAVFSIVPGPMTLEQAMSSWKENLIHTGTNLAGLIK